MADEYKQTPDGEELRKQGQKWLARIKDAEALEDTWLKDAEKAATAFTGEDGANAPEFNVLYANVETIVPAIINSPPAPDVRRRFGDTDEVAKDFSELMERAMRVQIDDSRLQLELEAVAQDAYCAGRGIPRIRFKADVSEEPTNDEISELAEDDAEGNNVVAEGMGNPLPNDASETVENEQITFEAVSWRDYRHGPAKRWADRKWDAFRHSMPQEDVDTFQDTTLVSGQMSEADRTERGESDSDLVVWEVWCLKSKTVKFIAEGTGVILKSVPDPLGLSQFFPVATPVQPIEVTGRLMPVNPYSIYRKLADELDTITKRINVVIDAMKVRGWYAGSATDLENVVDLDDNEFSPITDSEMWAAHGGIEKAVAFWPVDRFIVVLKELYTAREQTKQSIYEITGISDIVRGASKASETLGAQEIKSQWGSLRIQKAQRAMERCARDLFVMMSEIIPAKFSPETLQKMTGIQLIPNQQDLVPVQPMLQQGMQPEQQQQAMQQAQKAEQERQAKLAHLEALNQLMGERVATYYRVDVETDSTVRADLTRQKQEVAEFLQGSGTYFQAVGPLVADGTLPADVAIEIYASNARMFNLGKSTEDAIDNMIVQAKEKAKQPPAPNPEVMKAQAEMQMEQQRAQTDMQMQQQDMQIKGMQAKIEMQQSQTEMQLKGQEMQAKMELEMLKAQADGQKASSDAAIAVMAQSMKELELQMKQMDLLIKQKDLEIKRAQPVQSKEQA